MFRLLDRFPCLVMTQLLHLLPVGRLGHLEHQRGVPEAHVLPFSWVRAWELLTPTVGTAKLWGGLGWNIVFFFLFIRR